MDLKSDLLYHKELLLKYVFTPSRSKFFPLREVLISGMQLKSITAGSSSLPLVCVTFSAFCIS